MCVVAVGLIGSAQHIFHVGTNLVDNHHIRALALTDHHCSTSAKGNSLLVEENLCAISQPRVQVPMVGKDLALCVLFQSDGMVDEELSHCSHSVITAF